MEFIIVIIVAAHIIVYVRQAILFVFKKLTSIEERNRQPVVENTRLAKWHANNLRKIAKTLKGRVEDGAIFFRKADRHYQVRIAHHYGAHVIRCSSGWPDVQFRMKVTPETKFKNDKRHATASAQHVSIGNSLFDDVFVVQGDPGPQIKKLLSVSNVAKAIKKHGQLAFGKIEMEIVNGQIFFSGSSKKKTLSAFQVSAVLNNFAALHGEMLAAKEMLLPESLEQLGIDNLKLTKGRQSICMVCGEGILASQAVASCQSCDTRYHTDCWSYIGKCSTYGCHGRDMI